MDATDAKRFKESRRELNKFLLDDTLKENKVPILVLGNKIDCKDAVSQETMTKRLGLTGVTTGTAHHTKSKDARSFQPVELFMCSVVKRAGYAEGFRWLASYLKS